MKVTVQTKSGVFEIDSEAGENLLYAGLRQGLALPYECATGTCGTCRARLMDGDVRPGWDEAPGLSHVKQEKDELLMCQATAVGPCTLRVPAVVETNSGKMPDHRRGRLYDCAQLTHDVLRFSLALDRPVSFDPGQFMVLEKAGVPGGRAYSMTNHAPQTDRLDFVVKRKPQGGFSDWLFDGRPEGAELSVFGPLGRATFHPEEGRNILCIAGGSGIAGMMAMLQHGVSSRHFDKHRGSVFFGVRTAEDIFFAEELSDFVTRYPDSLSVTLALSDEEPDAALRDRYPALDFGGGFVHAVASERMAGKYDNMIGYVAGPPPMVDGALRVLVLEARLPGPDIRYDKFS